MYLLTDYSEEELSLMSKAINTLISENVNDDELPILREIHVRALTALQIVRDRQNVNSN